MAAGTLLSHLPDASIELAATADLSLSVDGHQLPLHSAVLAAGAQVLRAALCGAGIRGNASAKEVAAQLAFEGHSLEDTCSFLRVLYDTYTAEGMPASQLEGVLALAAKLGAPGVLQVGAACCASLRLDPCMPCSNLPHARCLQACDARLCALMKEAAPNSANGSTTDKDAPPLAIDWAHWLPLADRYRLRHLLPLLVEKQLRKMADASTYAEWKAAFVELDSSASALSADTWKLLCEGMAKTAVSYQNKANEDRGGYYRSSMGQLKDCIPKTFSRWSKPGDLF